MAIEVGIYQKLRDDPGVSSYVNGRIFGSLMPRDATLPCIVWTTVYTEDLGYSTQGASGLRKAMIQFDCYARKYVDSVLTKDAIRSLLQSFSGVLPDGTAVNGCIVMRDMDFPWEPGGGQSIVFRRVLEIDVIYTEMALPFVPPNTSFLTDDDSLDEVDDEGQA